MGLYLPPGNVYVNEGTQPLSPELNMQKVLRRGRFIQKYSPYMQQYSTRLFRKVSIDSLVKNDN